MAKELNVRNSIEDLSSVFNVIPGNSVLVLPDAPTYTIIAASDGYLEVTSRIREQLIGQGLFQVFPNNPADPKQSSEIAVRSSIEQAIYSKQTHQLPIQRYDLTSKEGAFEERYWSTLNKPVLSKEGEVIYLIHSVEDITSRVKAERREESLREIKKSYDLFMQAPVIVGILKGDDYIIELANEGLLEVWGRTADVVSKPLLTAIPELGPQGFIPLLEEVRTTGEPFYAYEFPIVLRRGGREEILFFDFVYKPFYENKTDAKASGIISVGHDVTTQVLARRKVQESEEKYRSLFESMDQGFCVLEVKFDANKKPVDYVFLETNPVFEEQTGLTNAIGKTARELIPQLEPHWFDLYGEVALTGQATRFRQEAKAMGKWFDVHAYKVGEPDSRKVAILFTDVTKAREAEAAIHLSNERFDLVAKATQDVIWDWNLQTDQIWWNDNFKTQFGYSEAEIEPTIDSWYNRVHPEDKERVIGGVQKVIDHGGKNWAGEYRFKRKDNSYAAVFDRGYIMHDQDGKAYRMLGSMQDITEAKKIQSALAESENNLRNIILHAPVAMCILEGPSFVVGLTNERMFEVWGKGAKDIMNKPIFEGLPEAANQGLEALLYDVYTTGKSFTANERPIDLPRNGAIETAYINFVYEPFKNGEGKIAGIMVVATDVTEQVLARMKVEETNRELKFVTDTVPQMVWATEASGYSYFFNKGWLEYTGLTLEDVKGSGWMQSLHPDDLERTSQAWFHAVETGDSYDLEYRVRRYDGVYRWFLVRGTPMKNEEGKIIKWYGTTTDIHDQKAATELMEQYVDKRTKDLQEANAHLTRLNAEMEQFTYVSHHDLQEPLRKIIMFTDIVKRESYEQLSEASQKRMDKVTDAARRMSAALREVLNFASLSKKENFQPTSLDEIVATVQTDLELLISEKDAKIHVDALPTIPALPGQMHQLFYNLLNNALKFSKSDQIPFISIKSQQLTRSEIAQHPDLEQSKSYDEIVVRDNGIGFEPEAADKIFGMFQRLHSRDAYAGTGIGLALCKKVVTNHRGKIIAESEPGKGASFKIILPVE